MNTKPSKPAFSRYQIFMIALLAILMFTVVLDFMVLSPLGALLMQKLNISTSQFGWVVSAYAFSAGASGFLAAGFADRFDRKKLLLFFYSGFIIGTLLCAIAPDYHLLLAARIITGIFGGVIGSICFAIISDLFALEVRGRVMGFVQMSFSASQVLGIPIGLMLANHFRWHSPFWMIAVFATLMAGIMIIYMKPVNMHLQLKSDRNPFEHLIKIISQKNYLRAFLATTLLATGGFMLMPFASAFGIHNMGISMEQLPYLYLITGLFSILFGPLIGILSDKVGKYRIFCVGSLLSILIVFIYTNLGITPFWLVLVINVFLFLGVSSRMITASALMSTVPSPQDRGAFMSVNSSVQQVSGGIASAIAGLIVVQNSSGILKNYNVLGYIVIGSMLTTILLLYSINQYVSRSGKKGRETGTKKIMEVAAADIPGD